MAKKRLLCLLLLLLVLAGGECYYYFKILEPQKVESKNEIKKNDEKLNEKSKEDMSKYLVDIFTPYYKDNLKQVFTKESDNLFYYLIEGLKNKEVETKVNNMIKEKIISLKEKYSDKVVTGYIFTNFENTLSVLFNVFESNVSDNFIKEVQNDPWFKMDYAIGSLNIDLTTGNIIEISDIVDDKEALKQALLTKIEEEATTSIGFICQGGPCENPEPDYSKIEDSVLSVMNKFKSGDYYFVFDPERIYFKFDDVYIYNPTYHGDEEKDCEGPNLKYYENEWDFCVDFANYDTEYDTRIDLIDLVKNLLIYDRFKTTDSIYENSSTKIEKKFTLNNEDSDEEYIDNRMVENSQELIDYAFIKNGYLENYPDIVNKIYNNVVEEVKSLKTSDFNVYNISGENKNFSYKYASDNREIKAFNYVSFEVYHYSLKYEDFKKFRNEIYANKYKRYYWMEGDIIYNYGYDFLKDNLNKKAFYYYIFDDQGKELKSKDILSDTFDFNTIIPNRWIESSNYNSIQEMVKDSLIIIDNEDFEIKDYLIFNLSYYNGNKILVKFKGEEIILADKETSFEEFKELLNQIFK